MIVSVQQDLGMLPQFGLLNVRIWEAVVLQAVVLDFVSKLLFTFCVLPFQLSQTGIKLLSLLLFYVWLAVAVTYLAKCMVSVQGSAGH